VAIPTPYIQLDLPLVLSPASRIEIADQISHLYAHAMGTARDIVSVAFRELGENGVLRPGRDGRPAPAIVVTCDIRAGRPTETRLHLAEALAELLGTTLGSPPEQVRIYFTQHSGEEIYRAGAFAPDWSRTTNDAAP
jgi:phenylpyruvate tautomerase PptA (4-oxalocrotonate tautomerase family)